MNHDFNIGNIDSLKEENKNEQQLGEWWTYLLAKNIIVAGFDGDLDDEGTRILRDIIGKGHWIFAYASKHGYVGVGLAESRKTYKLKSLEELPSDYLSNNLHHRGIKWLYYVESLNHAISISEIGGHYPRSTEQRIDNDIAEKILRAFLKKPETVIKF